MRTRFAWGAAVAALSLAVLVGCSSGTKTPNAAPTPSGTSSSAVVSATNNGPVNAADVAFVKTLAAIGSQNTSMAALVAGRAAHPQLAGLVPVITQHAHDIDAMRDWMNQWHQSVTGSTTAAGGSGAYLQAMATMRGAMFDDDWLEHMGGNYSAAIAACQQELAHGTNPQARQIAAKWMAWMHDQLDQMAQWHTAWMHDMHFPGTPSTGSTSTVVTHPHASDMPHPGTTHMTNMPHTPVPSHHSDLPPMDHSSMPGGPHMTRT